MFESGSTEKTYQSVLDSVHKIDGEKGYVDLFLIHTPNGGSIARKEMWLALERLHEEGKAKSIGVSNFGIAHIEEMKSYARIWPPQVNQIEVCAFFFSIPNDFGAEDSIAASMVPAEGNRRILQEERHRNRGIQPTCP